MHRALSRRLLRRRAPLVPPLAVMLVVVVALAVAVAGCGASSSVPGGQGASAAPPTAVATTTPGTAALNGCPTTQPPANLRAPDVVVRGGGETAQSSGSAVTLPVGQTLQVELPAVNRWRVVIADSNSILTQPSQNGWYDDHLRACVWQFMAVKTGRATLSYGGRAVCSPRSQCPGYVIAQSFSVTVQ